MICFGSKDNFIPFVLSIVEGSIVEGSIVEGSIVEGSIVEGSIVEGSIVEGCGSTGSPRTDWLTTKGWGMKANRVCEFSVLVCMGG